MSINVRQDHLAIIQNILKTFVPGCRVVAFGSWITQNARDTSDCVDIQTANSQLASFN